jgi:hypothetical protein
MPPHTTLSNNVVYMNVLTLPDVHCRNSDGFTVLDDLAALRDVNQGKLVSERYVLEQLDGEFLFTQTNDGRCPLERAFIAVATLSFFENAMASIFNTSRKFDQF